MKKLRVYVDTSVFGGVFDEEFRNVSQIFFDQVQAQYFSLVTSIIVKDEIQPAPAQVRNFFNMITLDSAVAKSRKLSKMSHLCVKWASPVSQRTE